MTGQQAGPARRGLGWRGIGWLASGLAAGAVIAWFIFLSPGDLGGKAEWFFAAAVVFVVVMVTMWQTLNIQHMAKREAAEAAERLHRELTAAEERSKHELALTQTLHQCELEAQQNLHRAEMDAQRVLARTERTPLLRQLQKQATVEVSRASCTTRSATSGNRR